MLTPKVYVVILNWNGARDTLECLKSLHKADSSNFDINLLVVDNASEKSDLDKIDKYVKAVNNVRIIKNNSNLGFAAGNNIGINFALKNGADFIFLLNNDTEVDAKIISQFIISAGKYPNSGIFSPKIYFAKGYEFHKNYKSQELGHVIWAAGGKIDWNNVYGTNFGVDQVDKGQFEKDRCVDFASGAAMFIRAEVFKRIGTFNEKYFMYFEDVEFCERYKRTGGNIMYLGGAHLWHKVAQSSAIGSELNDYYLIRNRLIFGMKYAPLRSRLALMKESLRIFFWGRKWQKRGIADFYSGNLYKGSWK